MIQAPDFPIPEDGEGGVTPEAAERERIKTFAQSLLKTRLEAIQARGNSGVERRWMEDLDAYHGRDAFNRPAGIIDTAQGLPSATNANSTPTTKPQQTARSTVFVQLTRQKTNTAAARVMEMLYPSDEKNWSIGPTPVPKLAKALQDGQNVRFRDPQTGGPLQHPDEDRELTVADVAADEMREAVEKAARMEKEIHDALEECQYVAVGRQVIMDAAQLGTGILKGPIVVNKTSRKWERKQDATGAVQVLTIKNDNRPATYRVDPWDFYPDPSCGEDIQDGAYVWEREWSGGRRLRELGRTEGYDRDAIMECLREGPMRITNAGQSYYELARHGDAYNQQSVHEDRRYELWTYTGEVDREGLEMLGVNIPEDQRELSSFSAIVVFCNDRAIKALLNPLDTGDLPYDVFTWEKVALSPFGVGIPYLMRYAQRTINAAWRALLDNMGVSAGPQIVASRSIVPADGRYEITGRKLWFAEAGQDADKAFKVFEIPSRQAELQAIIKLAMDFADAETALPQLAQGEQGNAPETVGGMTLLMNAANTVLKRLARAFDDAVTKPHIRRYYDWMMQYHQDDSIKGDMQIAARGSTALVQRDIRNQSMDTVIAASTHPVFGKYLDHKKLFRSYLEAKSITPDSVLLDDSTITANEQKAAQAPPPESPQEKVAKIRAQAEVKKVEVDTQSEATNEKLRQENAQRDRDHDIALANLKMQSDALKYAEARQITLTELKAELAMFVMDKQSARESGAAQREHDMQREGIRAASKTPAGVPA